MVRNNKTKNEITNDLSDFIGDKASLFVGWLWNFIPSYFASKTAAAAAVTSPTATTTSITNKSISPMMGESQESKKPTSRLILNAVKEASEDTRNIKLQQELTEMDEGEDKIDKENGGSSNGNGNSSNGLFKGKKYNNNRDNNRENREKKFKNNHSNNNNNNNNNNNGSSNGSNPTFTVTFNSDQYSKKRKNHSRDDDPLEHSLDEEIQLMGGNTNITPKKSKKERCQFWPLCKNGDACPYHHPTTQCMLFPNCQFGNKCLYIHPSIPCKFGVNCTNENCVYNHPQRSMAAVEVPCRNGFSCPNKKTGCSFFHPPLACKFGEKCTNGRNCPYGHGKPCLFGASCVTPGCHFAHHLTESSFPECKFGKECTNAKCKFTHSDRENTEELSNTLPSTPPRENIAVSMDTIESIQQDPQQEESQATEI